MTDRTKTTKKKPKRPKRPRRHWLFPETWRLSKPPKIIRKFDKLDPPPRQGEKDDRNVEVAKRVFKGYLPRELTAAAFLRFLDKDVRIGNLLAKRAEVSAETFGSARRASIFLVIRTSKQESRVSPKPLPKATRKANPNAAEAIHNAENEDQTDHHGA